MTDPEQVDEIIWPRAARSSKALQDRLGRDSVSSLFTLAKASGVFGRRIRAWAEERGGGCFATPDDPVDAKQRHKRCVDGPRTDFDNKLKVANREIHYDAKRLGSSLDLIRDQRVRATFPTKAEHIRVLIALVDSGRPSHERLCERITLLN